MGSAIKRPARDHGRLRVFCFVAKAACFGQCAGTHGIIEQVDDGVSQGIRFVWRDEQAVGARGFWLISWFSHTDHSEAWIPFCLSFLPSRTFSIG